MSKDNIFLFVMSNPNVTIENWEIIFGLQKICCLVEFNTIYDISVSSSIDMKCPKTLRFLLLSKHTPLSHMLLMLLLLVKTFFKKRNKNNTSWSQDYIFCQTYLHPLSCHKMFFTSKNQMYVFLFHYTK